VKAYFRTHPTYLACPTRPAWPSRFSRHGGDQRLDVAERERERLEAAGVAGDRRHVIGHHHPVESDFLVHPHRLQHVDVAVVDERLLEIQEAAADVAEVDVEDLPAAAEVAD